MSFVHITIGVIVCAEFKKKFFTDCYYFDSSVQFIVGI